MRFRKIKRPYIAIILVIVIVISSLNISKYPVEAKGKTVNITLKYKNKKVILAKYTQNKAGFNTLSYQMHFNTVQKRLGIGKTDTNYRLSDAQTDAYAYYIYKTRKDCICIEPRLSYHGNGPWIIEGPGDDHTKINKKFNPVKGTSMDITITSKNFSLNGLRVGMSKKAAEKQMRKYFKHVRVGKDSIAYDKLIKYKRSWIQTPTYSFDYGQINLTIKNGKVTAISYQNSDEGSDNGEEPDFDESGILGYNK